MEQDRAARDQADRAVVRSLDDRGGGGGSRPVRRPEWWDRIKILFVLLLAFAALFWATVGRYDPVISTADAFGQTLRSYWWLLALAVLELLRQLHYLIAEHAPRYARFWKDRVFRGLQRRRLGMSDWTRYRVARFLKVLFFLAILDLILAKALALSPATALFQLPLLLFKALPFVLQLAFAFFFVIFQFVGLFWFLSKGGVDVYMPDDIKTRFSDVWGQDNVLARVQENMLFLEAPDLIEEKGGYVPGGILLWGPPGTGKTLMAEAVAGETGKPFVFVDPGAFINMFFGIGILKVKSLFRKLRKLAVRYGGVIVFFDEADSLGSRGAMPTGPWGGQWSPQAEAGFGVAPPCNGVSYLSQATQMDLFRSGLASSGTEEGRRRGVRERFVAGMGGMGGGGMGTLQALLTELSGLKKPRGFLNRVVRRLLGMRPQPPPKYRILVMMATNMPQALDEALLRPGRIDRIYKVGYPSKVGRIRTYQGYFAKVRHHLTDDDLDRLATITPYATGATIKDLVNEALINAIRNDRDTITWADVIRAKQLKDLGPPEDVEYIERERHAVAVHEACHAVAAYRVRRHLTIDIATIEKGGTYLGMVASIPPEDQFTRWRSEYEADIMVALASLAGERMFFEGDSSSGVSGDLEGATRLATFMEGFWGMGSTIASHGVTHEIGIGGGGKPGQGAGEDDRKLLQGTLGQRIEEKLGELLDRTERLLREHRAEVLALAHGLETNKTLTGEDVEAIIEGRRGPLVDGRPYRTSDFVELAERYHTEAVMAHKGHGRVKVRLPVLVRAGLPPAGVDGDGAEGMQGRRAPDGADAHEGWAWTLANGDGPEGPIADVIASSPEQEVDGAVPNGHASGPGDEDRDPQDGREPEDGREPALEADPD